MNRKQHNKRGIEFGIRDKYAPSQRFPGCKHHGFNGTNLNMGRGGRINVNYS